jgi:RNA polymerase sigma factor (sigma-70 family)
MPKLTLQTFKKLRQIKYKLHFFVSCNKINSNSSLLYNQPIKLFLMNQKDFISIINPFKDKVFRMAKRLLVSTEEAEDATQEVLVKLWTKSDRLNDLRSVEAMAMTMTKNYCLDQLKSKRASNMTLVHSNYTDREAGLQQKVEDRDSWNWVEKIINELPEQQKLIIQMRDIEQYEFEEIAKIMDMNETAIRVALSRGRKTIREFMTKTHNYGIG